MSAVGNEKSLGSSSAKFVIVIDDDVFKLVDVEVFFRADRDKALNAKRLKPGLYLFPVGILACITFRKDLFEKTAVTDSQSSMMPLTPEYASSAVMSGGIM